jgi:hypothetical protein
MARSDHFQILQLSYLTHTSVSELRWCKYSSKDSSLWDSDTEQDRTEFYSFTDTNRQVSASPSRRPPVLEDFERTWENVLVEGGAPDWSAVSAQQWRTWFEFYKATRKVSFRLYSVILFSLHSIDDL